MPSIVHIGPTLEEGYHRWFYGDGSYLNGEEGMPYPDWRAATAVIDIRENRGPWREPTGGARMVSVQVATRWEEREERGCFTDTRN